MFYIQIKKNNKFGNYVMNRIFMWKRKQKQQEKVNQFEFCDVQVRDGGDLNQRNGKGDKKVDGLEVREHYFPQDWM